MRVVLGPYSLALQECASEAELVRELESVPSEHGLLIGGRESSARYYLVRVDDDVNVFLVGVICEDHGITPNVCLLGDRELVFGFNQTVVGIRCSQKRITFEHDLPGLFYRFYQLPSNRVLVLNELGVSLLSDLGDLLWGYDKDIVEGVEITSASIRLTFMDSPAVTIDIETGAFDREV